MRSLVSPNARRAYAALLREFIAGGCTNDEYENRVDEIKRRHGRDSAVMAIYHQMWFCYDDIRTHTMRGSHRLTAERRRFFARCVLFLRDPSVPRSPWPEQVHLREDVLFALSLAFRIAIAITIGVWLGSAFGLLFVGVFAGFFVFWILSTVRQYDPHSTKRALYPAAVIWPFENRAAFERSRAQPGLLGVHG